MNEKLRNLLKNKYIKLMLIVVFGIILILIYQLMFKSEPAARKEVLRPLVHVEAVYKKAMYKEISLFGKTEANAQIDIINKFAGKIANINVDLGSFVHKGDILIEQDLQDAEAELQKAYARYRENDAKAAENNAEFNSDYYKYKADYELAKLNYERYKKLYDMGAVAKADYDSKKQIMVNAQAAYEALSKQKNYGDTAASVYAREQVAERRYQEYILAQNKKTDMILKAPGNGIISYRNAEIGEYIPAGTKLLTITDNSKLHIDCNISEANAAVVKADTKITMNIEALGKSFDGIISYVSPDKNKESNSYLARIKLLEQNEEIKSGMFARGYLKILIKEDALYVNKDIIKDKNGKKYVFIVNKDNQLEQREVTLGINNDTEVEIIDGINEGEVVVLDNLSRLRDGIKVQIDKTEED